MAEKKNNKKSAAQIVETDIVEKEEKAEMAEDIEAANDAPVEETKTGKITKAGKHSAKAQKEEAAEEAKSARKLARQGVDEKQTVKHVPHIKKYAKNYKSALESFDRNKNYDLLEAIALIQKVSKTKFDATVEVHVRLSIDPRQSDQAVRTSVTLPSGTGKTVRIAVIANDKDASTAKTAGADMTDKDAILATITKNKFDFDILIATPDQMAALGKYAKVLGPKGLMPTPKSGTVTADPAAAVKEIKQGRVELKADANGIVHSVLGKVSFPAADLLSNARAVIDAVQKAKPSTSKGTYILSIYLAASMSPSVRVEPTSIKTK